MVIKIVSNDSEKYLTVMDVKVYTKGTHSEFDRLIAKVINSDICDGCRYIASVNYNDMFSELFYILVGDTLTIEGTTYTGEQ